MLDDLKYIHDRDAQDALGIAEKQWQQLGYDFGVTWQPGGGIRNVVLAGMGGSALPGVFVPSWPKLAVPFEIVRNYTLPDYVDEHTLVISSSHSGNTEETLSALADAEAKGAQIVVIASGGTLAEQAKSKNYALYQVPGGIQPRMTTFFFIRAFCEIFIAAGLIPAERRDELAQAGEWLKTQVSGWKPDVAAANNQAKQLAQELMGKTVIVYAGPVLAPAANKWKICMNENAKNLAWWNQYPEFNHNEFIGWSSHPTDKPFAVVELRSGLEHPRIQKRFEVTERLLSGKRPHPHAVEVQGQSILQQLLWAVSLGDFVSLYLALLNGLNPTPVDLVEKLKTVLND